MQWSQLKELTLHVELLTLDPRQLFLLLGKLVREYLLLVVHNLEVFFGAEQLVVVVCCLALCLQYLILLLFDHLLEFALLREDELVVSRLLHELRLQTCDGGA